jgi:hypothetical protein
MNKKFYAGLMATGIAASFWACGSGDILEPTESDTFMGMWFDEDTTSNLSAIVPDMMNAINCPQCFAGTVSSSSKTPVVNSSSSNPPVFQSSSSEVEKETKPTSSSSRTSYDYSSSSNNGGDGPVLTSSSSSASEMDTKLGTCAPEKSTIESDETVTWVFTKSASVNPQSLLNATYTWTIEGATYTKDYSAANMSSGANGFKREVKYTTSGVHTAKLAISMGAAVYQLDCAPLQVNGAPIDGCTCAADAASVDYTAGTPVKWSVTGCSTGDKLELSYTWDGQAGTNVFEKTFEGAMASYKPVLKVANNDNTIIDVACPAVKVTEGPEYNITERQQDGAVAIPAGETLVHVKVPASGQTCVIFCQTTWDAETQGKLDMTVGGVEKSGAFNVTVDLPSSSCEDKDVKFVLSAPATCGVQ